MSLSQQGQTTAVVTRASRGFGAAIVTDAAALLASERASAMTGTVANLTGGVIAASATCCGCWLARGASNAEIAAELRISSNTVATHVARILT